MLSSKSFLAVDFGAGTLKLAEFEPNESGGLRLKQYAVKALGAEGAQESTREAAILKGLQELLASKSWSSRNVNVCAPGFHVFSKFVKLPPVDTSKVTQIIQYEAQQNVPFPLEEVVWDYQILGTSPTGELEVLLVAIKKEVVEGLFKVGDAAAVRLQLVDVSPAALCNAFRYNYGDLEGCTMLLDIGAKTSNLLFFEKGKVYSRSINIGSNAITQDFASEAKLPFAEAERIKIEEGFVSLGGAYEEPENPHQAAISKIARQVMTRLHIQVNQTVQFYRGQQGGGAPQRLFLSGGGSIMPYTAQFFAEKLNVTVDYFNPFRNIQVAPALNIDELAKVAHAFGEVIGLALRNLAHCPVELNLMPKSSLQRQEFSQKKPFLLAAVFSLALVVLALGFLFNRLAAVKNAKVSEIQSQIDPLTAKEKDLTSAKEQLNAVINEATNLTELAQQKYYWPEIVLSLKKVLRQTEIKTAQQSKSPISVGIWFESFAPVGPAGVTIASADSSSGGSSGSGNSEVDAAIMRRYGLRRNTATTEGDGSTAESPSSTDAGSINIVCRAITTSKSVTARDDLIYNLRDELKSSGLFTTNTFGTITDDAVPAAFSFPLTLKLARPVKF